MYDSSFRLALSAFISGVNLVLFALIPSLPRQAITPLSSSILLSSLQDHDLLPGITPASLYWRSITAADLLRPLSCYSRFLSMIFRLHLTMIPVNARSLPPGFPYASTPVTCHFLSQRKDILSIPSYCISPPAYSSLLISAVGFHLCGSLSHDILASIRGLATIQPTARYPKFLTPVIMTYLDSWSLFTLKK